MNGYCDSWDCNMQTVEDVKKEAVNEYVKAVVEELEKSKDKGSVTKTERLITKACVDKAIEIVKEGIRKDISE